MRPRPLIESVMARGRVVAVGLVLGTVVSLFAASGASAVPQAQVPTPTPFRFVTPAAPAAPAPAPAKPAGPSTTVTTPRPATPTGGGFPLELAIPALAGGLAAIGGGAYLFRRKTVR